MISTHLENTEQCARTCPIFHEKSGFWLYGNVRLLRTDLAHVAEACKSPHPSPDHLNEIEQEAERLVLAGKTLVVGVHNYGHMRAAVVPLRWGSPRIVVFSGGFYYHLGEKLDEEPFRTARLWRYQWDASVDLALSRRAPDKRPTFALDNPTIDRLIGEIAEGRNTALLNLVRALKLP